MNISNTRNMRGSSSQPAADTGSNDAVPSLVPGRKTPSISVPEGFSIADIRTGGLWSILDYTNAVYTGIEKD
jgi:hypothetical protein